MWLLTIHRSFRPSPGLQVIGISGITCAQPTMFPMLKTCKTTAAGAFLTCTNFPMGSKLPEFHVLWWAPGLTRTRRKLHPRSGAWLRKVVSVATGDDHSAHNNISLGDALPTPSRSVGPLHASSGFLCIDKSEICIHLLNPQLEPWYHGKYRAPLRAVVHPIYTSCYDSYTWETPECSCILSHGALRLGYCRVMLWSLWS